MKKPQLPAPLVVMFAAGGLFTVWCLVHLRELTLEQDGWIRFVLASFFSLLILRRKPAGGASTHGRHIPPVSIVLAGTAIAVAGTVFRVRLFEWAGIVLALGGCLSWARPAPARETVGAMAVLFLAHPMPSRLFGGLQLAMQWLSVSGCERLLHMFNVRVWADGFVLRTGFSAFEIPASCSGMRTATTVFILSVALGIMKRHAFFQTALLTLAALVQAVILNMLRIGAMIVLAPFAGQQAEMQFLHDSTGWIVVLAVVLVYVEIGIVDAVRERGRIRRAELNLAMEKILIEAPLSWQRLLFQWKSIVALAIVLAVAGTVAYRSRPAHRAAMLKDVAVALRDTGKLHEASRLAAEIRRLVPDDIEWELASIRILMLRGEYDLALKALDLVSDTDPGQVVQKKILRAYCRMGKKDLDAAWAIVQTLPESVVRTDPRVNMILAEMGYRSRDPKTTARSAAIASEWAPNTARVRALFPFLREHREWKAIAKADIRTPFSVSEQAMSAAEAYMNMNSVPFVADIAMSAIRQWPDDPRVLEPLFFMATKRGSEWEDRFSAHLRRCLPGMTDPDRLYDLFDKCFSLLRPDLAWTVFGRLNQESPGHPYADLTIARYGHLWFTFGKRHVGVEAASEQDGINLNELYALGCHIPAWRDLCGLVPEGMLLSAPDVMPFRKAALARARTKFEKLDVGTNLSIPMLYAYISVLEIDGDVDTARARLEKMALEHPAESERARVVLSEIYERHADWEGVYETLRQYGETRDPALMPMLRLGKALVNLRLSLAARSVARFTADRFPDSVQAAAMLANILNSCGLPEEALAVAGRRPRQLEDLDFAEARALFLTERFRELENFARSALLPRIEPPAGASQHLFFAPAALALLWHRVNIPSDREFEEHAARLTDAISGAKSPFLSSMMKLWLTAYSSKCAKNDVNPDTWAACGRDNMEKATALNQLCLLLSWAGRMDEAREAARRATEQLPQAPSLWHVLVSLSGGDRSVIAGARSACPDDPELWLADLVRKTEMALAGTNAPAAEVRAAREWIESEPRAAAGGDRFPPATVTRGGEHLFHAGFRAEASALASNAVARARSALPAYVLGIRCALAEADADRAMRCTTLAIDASLSPPPILFEKLVDLKSMGDVDTDSEMVATLNSLRTRDPDNPRWAQMLGYVRFKRGGWEIVDALGQMNEAIDAGVTNKTPYVIAAEASRLLGNTERAAGFLRKGLSFFPDDIGLLNNLVYTLAFDRKGIQEAVTMLPGLLARSPSNVQVLDTAVVVFLRADQAGNAERMIPEILSLVPAGSVEWFRANMYKASIALKQARPSDADRVLREILRYSETVPDEDVLAANRLLAEAVELGGGRKEPEIAPPEATFFEPKPLEP
jgi:exosortase